MNGRLASHFTAPVAAVRPLLLVRLLYLTLSVDIWLHFVGRSPFYGLGGFNVAHFAWLDALLPLPTPGLYAVLMVVTGFAALSVALRGPDRLLMAVTCGCFTLGWAMSQLDSYQHHYFLSLVLLLSIFLPPVTPAMAVARPAAPVEGAAGSSWATVSAWALPLIGIQVAVLYFWAAISKLDPRWLAGRVMGDLSTSGEGVSTDAVPLLGALLGDRVWPLLAVGTVIGELLLVVGYLMFVARDRRSSKAWSIVLWASWLTAMGLHLGIEWFHLRIGLFSYYMMALACVFLLPAGALMPLARGLAWLSSLTGAACSRVAASAGGLGAALLTAVALAVVPAVLVWRSDLPAVAPGVTAGGAASLAALLWAWRTAGRSGAVGQAVSSLVFTLMMAGFLLLSPLPSELHLATAQAQSRLGETALAIRHYRHAEQLLESSTHPATVALLAKLSNNLGNLHQDMAQWEEAQKCYLRAIERMPDSIEARMNLSGLYSINGRMGDAAEMLVQVIERNPGHAEARYNLGVILLGGGKLDPAIAQFKAAVEAAPGMIEAHNNLATAYIMKKDHAAAVTPLRRILELDPRHAEAANNLAIILATSRDPALRNLEEALRLAEQGARLTGRRQAEMLRTVARVLSEMGRHEEVQAVMDEIARLRSEGPAQGP